MINAIIIDDEKKSRETLNAMLNRHCPAVNVLAHADGVRTGLEAIEKHQPDVVFLDIQMLDGSGFKLLQKVGNINFEIIFVTAFDQYAIKAIKYSALDYLLKPIISRDLILAVEKVEKKKTRSLKDARIKVLLENIKSTEIHPQKIILSTIEKIHVIEIGNIIRCESDNYYTKFFFRDGKSLLVSKTLKENEEMLRDHNFIRPHKSHLVNLFYVKSFIKHDGGYIVLSDGSKVPVSRRKREKVVEIINNL
ncbi:MAG: response regulator transcription factor [Bacteroidales bacterium]|nr:response regulator transcription factor [Bacteroidales bacterium]